MTTKQYGTLTSHPVFWGGGGYRALWNEAPFNNNMDLFIIKDDYTRVFGKHFVKAGVLVSVNKKNEDTNGNGSQQHSAFWGAAGLPGQQLQRHRQRALELPAEGHVVGVLGTVGGPFGADTLARSRVVCRRLVAGFPKSDLRLRPALFPLLQPVRGRRHDHQLRAGAVQSGARQRPVQRAAPGSRLERVPGGRRPRRHGRPEPLADGPGLQQLRAAARRRVGHLG